jgi:hypothetical protein
MADRTRWIGETSFGVGSSRFWLAGPQGAATEFWQRGIPSRQERLVLQSWRQSPP